MNARRRRRVFRDLGEDIFHHPTDHERMSIDVSRLSDVRLLESEAG